ncbi:hypothetical protein HK102_006163, partial [Quaeritorhiza haematococci]
QVFGMYTAYGPDRLSQTVKCTYPQSASNVNLVSVVVVWGILALGVWILTLVLLLWTSKKKKRYSSNFTKYQELWKRRLEWICCGHHLQLTSGPDVIADVATELAHFFSDVDWAPSDIMVGLVLLKRAQKKLREQEQEERRIDLVRRRDKYMSAEPPALPVMSVDGQVPRYGNKPELAAPLRPTSPPPTSIPVVDVPMPHTDSKPGVPKISVTTGGTGTAQQHPPHTPMTKAVESDEIMDILHFAKYAEVVYNQLEAKTFARENLLHFSDVNDLFKAPYLIALDHEWKSVVVAIRGTYSASDILVDLKFDLTMLDIPELGDGPVHWTHSGILRTAENIMKDIREEHILKPLFEDPTSKYRGYRLVVCGHSLGAVSIFAKKVASAPS